MNKKGFTLIEILVVLVVIGILVAVILPNTLKAIQQGNARAAAATLRNIDAALQVCYNDTGGWATCGPGGIPDLTNNSKYMEAIPTADSNGVAYQIVSEASITGVATDQGWVSQKTTHFSNWPDVTSYL